MHVFSLQGELNSCHTTLLFIIVPSEPAENLIDPQNRVKPLLTEYLSWWPLSLLPCYQMEPVSIGTQNNPMHLLCVNRWNMRRWVISLGARMQNIKEGDSLAVCDQAVR